MISVRENSEIVIIYPDVYMYMYDCVCILLNYHLIHIHQTFYGDIYLDMGYKTNHGYQWYSFMVV